MAHWIVMISSAAHEVSSVWNFFTRRGHVVDFNGGEDYHGTLR
jgi:hypothetical protein